MEMIIPTNELVRKHFKTMGKCPEWFEVDKKLTNGESSYKEMIYLKTKSLVEWHNFMLTNEDDNSTSRRTDAIRWSGTYDWNEYLGLLDNGDKSVMKAIKDTTNKATKELSKKHEKVIARYKFDVVGEQFDVGLVLSGVPEVWLEPEFEEQEVPQVTLKLNLTYKAVVNQKDIIENAGRILGIAKVLETMGVQVKIEGFNIFNSYDIEHMDRVLMLETTIKDFDEPINFKKVSAFTSPAQFRRGGFYIQDLVTDKLDFGRGNQTHLKNTVALYDTKEINKLEESIFKHLGGE
jgi:hypothetical protein